MHETRGASETAYRRTIAAAAQAEQRRENIDRARAVQRALNSFASQSITGYIDSRGRRYDLPTYVELAVRAAITRAEVDAYCAQVAQAGHDLVIISDVPGACDICRPFEGRVLSISGTTVGAITPQ